MLREQGETQTHTDTDADTERAREGKEGLQACSAVPKLHLFAGYTAPKYQTSALVRVESCQRCGRGQHTGGEDNARDACVSIHYTHCARARTHTHTNSHSPKTKTEREGA